jgi:hypothetical protein
LACPCSPFSARKRHFLPRRCNTHQSWVELAVPGRVSGHAGSVQSVPHVQTLLAEEARPSVRRIHRVPRRQRRVQPRTSCLLPLFHLILAKTSSGARLGGAGGMRSHHVVENCELSWSRWWSLDNRRNPDGSTWMRSLRGGPTSLPCICPSSLFSTPCAAWLASPQCPPARWLQAWTGWAGQCCSPGCALGAGVASSNCFHSYPPSSHSSSTKWPFSRSSIPPFSILPSTTATSPD